jgi:uncharacterized protein (TIGR00661 family)
MMVPLGDCGDERGRRVRILYGVCGEGMGHATRSHVFLADLVRDHEVYIVASGRARDYLAAHFPTVKRIMGFTLAYEDNALRRWETVVQNLRGAVTGWPRQVRSYYDVAREFAPDAVVSDFDSFSLLVARRQHVPAITVDNITMLDRCVHDEGIVGDDTLDFELARQVAHTHSPGAFHYIVPTFFRPALRKRRTTLVAPTLRPAVLAAVPENGEHLLVYQTAEGSETLVQTLRETGLPCRVYGIRRGLEGDVAEGELLFRPFSEATFLDDLRTARAVIAGGGFTLLSECVYLHKPVLSFPVRGQFEQTLNGRYIERLGYGLCAPEPTADIVNGFLARLDDFHESLASYRQDGNEEALAALRAQLAAARERNEERAARRSTRRDSAPRAERRSTAGDARDAGTGRRGDPSGAG